MYQLSVSEETRERIDWIRLADSCDKDLVLKLAGSWKQTEEHVWGKSGEFSFGLKFEISFTGVQKLW